MKLSVNRHAPFDDPERAEVEARVIQRVETDPEKLFELYRQLPESMNGRYINSDLFKEIFPEYAASPAHRTVFNVPIHNSAAVLANALFHQAVAAQDLSHGNAVLFVTGIPGAGKTTAIKKADLINFDDYKVIYEGQLSNFEQSFEKIDWCIKHGCEVDVFAFHQKPEIALRHTFNRFDTLGRGASIHAMANIQGNLGASMAKLYEKFCKQVEFCTLDLRCQPPRPVCGPEHIEILKSEGDYDAIRTRLQKELRHWRDTVLWYRVFLDTELGVERLPMR